MKKAKWIVALLIITLIGSISGKKVSAGGGDPDVYVESTYLTTATGGYAYMWCEATSPDGSALSYVWYSSQTPEIWTMMAINKGTETNPGLSVYYESPGFYYYWCMVSTANGGFTYSDMITVEVTEMTIPYIHPDTLPDAKVGEYYQASVWCDDPNASIYIEADGNQILGLTGLHYDEAALTISGTPTEEGDYYFCLISTGAGAALSQWMPYNIHVSAGHSCKDADGLWDTNADYHFHVCSCGNRFDYAEHSPNIAQATADTDKVCTVCGYVMQKKTGKTESSKSESSKSEANKQESSKTESSRVTEKEHKHQDKDGKWNTAADYHYHRCTCGYRFDKENHTFEKDKKGSLICTVCGYKKGDKTDKEETSAEREERSSKREDSKESSVKPAVRDQNSSRIDPMMFVYIGVGAAVLILAGVGLLIGLLLRKKNNDKKPKGPNGPGSNGPGQNNQGPTGSYYR